MRIIIEIDNQGNQTTGIQLNNSNDSSAITSSGGAATDAGAPSHLSETDTQAEVSSDFFTASAIPDSIKAEATSAGAAPGD